jgi:hypothetical protein
MQDYSKGRFGSFMPVHFHAYVEAKSKAIIRGVWGPSYWSIIMDK